MVSVVIINNQEANVVQYTFELLYSELKDIAGSELLIRSDWDISGIKNRFVCFVEADCLVSPGYFRKQLDALQKLSPRIAVLAPVTAVKHWDNIIYGYSVDSLNDRVTPRRLSKADLPFPVQVAFIPGAFIRLSCLKRLGKLGLTDNLVESSIQLSLAIWQSGISTDTNHLEGQLGRQIYVNPHVTYATTAEYVNDISSLRSVFPTNLLHLFSKESI